MTSQSTPPAFPCPTPATEVPLAGALDADLVDDLLYLARTGDLEELRPEVSNLLHVQQELGKTAGEAWALIFDEQSGNSMMHMAAANGHLETLKYIITQVTSAGSSASTSSPPRLPPPEQTLHWPNHAGNTPLHYAAMNGQLAAAQLLLEHGAKPSRLNCAGHTSRVEAERAGRDEVAGYLLALEGVGEAGGEAEVKGEEQELVVNGDGHGEASGETVDGGVTGADAMDTGGA